MVLGTFSVPQMVTWWWCLNMQWEPSLSCKWCFSCKGTLDTFSSRWIITILINAIAVYHNFLWNHHQRRHLRCLLIQGNQLCHWTHHNLSHHPRCMCPAPSLSSSAGLASGSTGSPSSSSKSKSRWRWCWAGFWINMLTTPVTSLLKKCLQQIVYLVNWLILEFWKVETRKR